MLSEGACWFEPSTNRLQTCLAYNPRAHRLPRSFTGSEAAAHWWVGEEEAADTTSGLDHSHDTGALENSDTELKDFCSRDFFEHCFPGFNLQCMVTGMYFISDNFFISYQKAEILQGQTAAATPPHSWASPPASYHLRSAKAKFLLAQQEERRLCAPGSQPQQGSQGKGPTSRYLQTTNSRLLGSWTQCQVFY